MDTCGTGGGLSTFNISTATAIAAAAGIPIAKHAAAHCKACPAVPMSWKHWASSLTTPPGGRMIEERHSFYCPLFHPVCAGTARRVGAGHKTIFTYYRPLINPAFAPRHRRCLQT